MRGFLPHPFHCLPPLSLPKSTCSGAGVLREHTARRLTFSRTQKDRLLFPGLLLNQKAAKGHDVISVALSDLCGLYIKHSVH